MHCIQAAFIGHMLFAHGCVWAVFLSLVTLLALIVCPSRFPVRGHYAKGALGAEAQKSSLFGAGRRDWGEKGSPGPHQAAGSLGSWDSGRFLAFKILLWSKGASWWQ